MKAMDDGSLSIEEAFSIFNSIVEKLMGVFQQLQELGKLTGGFSLGGSEGGGLGGIGKFYSGLFGWGIVTGKQIMATVETYQLRGRNYDEVVRQLISTYNISNGWSLVRVVNRLTSLDVILERNSEQGVSKDTSKATPTEKDRKSTRLNSSHSAKSRMPSSA